MASRSRTSPTPRIPLSRERVLDAAISVADREGIEAMTMRRLAQELGVEAMTIYYHVPNKEQILDGMVARVMGEIELPEPGEPWKVAIRRMALSARDTLARHPWATGRMMTGGLTAERLRYMESILGCFRAGGFTSYQTHLAYHAIESHIVGFTLWLAGMNLPPDLSDLATDVMRQVSADDYPAFIEHIEEHLREPRPTDVGTFEFGLDLILDGLERMLRDS